MSEIDGVWPRRGNRVETPRVSVIIPAWNAERWVARAVTSALEQDPAPLEVIVADDGSTDGTARVADSCGATVRVIRCPHAGTAAARNAAMDAASGDFLAFLDADDEWLPGKLRDQIAALQETPEAGVVYCDLLEVDSHGVAVGRYLAGRPHATEGWVLANLIRHCFVLPSAAVVRRDVCKRHGIRFRTDLVITEDYEFFLTLARHCPYVYVDRPLVRRTIHLAAKTYVTGEQAARDHVRLLGRLRDTVVEDDERPREVLPLIDRRLSHFECKLGLWRYRSGDARTARQLFARSLRRRPKLRTAAMWAVTFAGEPGERMVKWLRGST